MAGYLVLQRSSLAASVAKLVVAPARRRQGVGRRLLRRAVALAKEGRDHLALTRYSFTPTYSCTSQSSFYRPLHLHCSHYCNTNARLMRYIRPPPPVVYAIHHTILGNIVFRPSITHPLRSCIYPSSIAPPPVYISPAPLQYFRRLLRCAVALAKEGRAQVSIYIYIYVYVCVCVYMCIYICVCVVCVYIFICVYIYLYIYVYISIHTYI